MSEEIRNWCECEHSAHTDRAEGVKTPNGNPGHEYGANFNKNYMKAVKVPFGTFNVCLDCADDCLAEYQK